MKILVTGVAGFIGFHLSKRLLEEGETIVVKWSKETRKKN